MSAPSSPPRSARNDCAASPAVIPGIPFRNARAEIPGLRLYLTPRDPPCALIRSRLPNPSPPPCAAVPSHGAIAAPPHHPTPAHRSRAEAPRRLQGRPAPTQGVQEPSAPLLRSFPRAPLRLAAGPRRQAPCATSPATRSPGENPQPSPVLLALEFVVRSPWRRPERSRRRTPPRSPAIAAAHSVPRPNPLP